MTENTRYIEWRKNKNSSPEALIAEIMKHWELRYELGTAVLLVDDSTTMHKLAEKQWKKLTRQAQKERELQNSAEDILQITRTISRMQRVNFSSKDPSENPDAKFYVLSEADFKTLPGHCYTLYATTKLPDTSTLKLLPADSLIVAYQTETVVADIHPKSVIEERLLSEESALIEWLAKHAIQIDVLKQDVEKANEALDTLLSSNSLQSEFLHKTKLYLHLVQLAQPVRFTEQQQEQLAGLKQLEHHVRVLSPAFLSDHIIDNQSDESFLLRDPATGKTLTHEALRSFIASEQKAGRLHLAKALEQQAGFVRI
jgi:hypothetical protein